MSRLGSVRTLTLIRIPKLDPDTAGKFTGARASGVGFSALRRKHSATNFVGQDGSGSVRDNRSDSTRGKVRPNLEVRNILLATGDLVLKPDHHQELNAPATWRYYEILTQPHAYLQKRK